MPDRPPPSPPSRRPLGVLVAVAVVWLLTASKPVAMPLAFALFFAVLLDPVRRALARRLPDAAAVGLTFLAAVGALATFVGAVTAAARQATDGLGAYGPELGALRDRLAALPVDAGGGGALGSAVQAAALDAWSVAGYTVLILALLALALAEVPAWGHKLRDRFGSPVSDGALDAAGRIARQVRRFVAVQALTSVVTGVLTGLFCWALGVDLPFVWGLLAGVLNVVPTLGSIVAVVPPSLFAALQFGLGWRPVVVLVGLGAIQVVIGAWLDPKLQGRYLRLSALVVLVAITFWTWAWGVAGAFIAVPLTAAVVVAFGEFDETEWLQRLLTRDEPASGRVDAGSAPLGDRPPRPS